MKLYAFRSKDGDWYEGYVSTGRVKCTPTLEDARFFNQNSVQYAEECLNLGLDMYEFELSEPVLVKEGSGNPEVLRPRYRFDGLRAIDLLHPEEEAI